MTTTDSAKAPPTVAPAIGTEPVTTTRSRDAIQAERRAWLVLWLAFLTFCVLVGSVFKFVTDYVSTAQVAQIAQVEATRGLILISAQGSEEESRLTRSELGVGTVVAPARNAQADLRLFDDSKVSVLAAARLELTRMEVGRFINQYALVLDQTAGPVRYETMGAVDVGIPQQGVVHLGPNGDYTVWVDGDSTRVLVYEGEARLETNIGNAYVGKGRRAEFDGQRPQVFDRPKELLRNSDLARHAESWDEHDLPDSKLDVNGQRQWISGPEEAGQPVSGVRFVRESVRNEHGETGLLQKLDVNVSGFRHVWLQAWVRVDAASLSGGGQLGSEYPMMLRLQYEGAPEGSEPDWVVGFYTANPELRPVAPWAVLWPAGIWQLYRADLMDTDESRQPYQLHEFEVMAQGHSYDASIAGIELIGD